MRRPLLVLALLFGGVAVYLHLGARNSMSGYSSEQLDLLEAEVQRPGGAPTADELFARELIKDERWRRIALPIASVIAGLAAIAGLLIRGPRGAPAGSSAEERRLVRRG